MVNAAPRPLCAWKWGPIPIVQETGWAPGPVWANAEIIALTGTRPPDRPTRSESLYRLSYTVPRVTVYRSAKKKIKKAILLHKSSSDRFSDSSNLNFIGAKFNARRPLSEFFTVSSSTFPCPTFPRHSEDQLTNFFFLTRPMVILLLRTYWSSSKITICTFRTIKMCKLLKETNTVPSQTPLYPTLAIRCANLQFFASRACTNQNSHFLLPHQPRAFKIPSLTVLPFSCNSQRNAQIDSKILRGPFFDELHYTFSVIQKTYRSRLGRMFDTLR